LLSEEDTAALKNDLFHFFKKLCCGFLHLATLKGVYSVSLFVLVVLNYLILRIIYLLDLQGMKKEKA
jgi:hypothetical protein